MPATLELRDAAQARRAALASSGAAVEARTSVPGGTARSRPFAAQLRAQTVSGADGKSFVELDGCASTYERAYEMWDMFGPYNEVVSAGAGTESLAAGPDVSFLSNHKGLTMARTTNGTLVLSEDEGGLRAKAKCNPKRTDVADLAEAIRDGDITEMSFAFRITSGQWSPDYTEYRINGYDINRGDVSAVNYGANPHTSIEARSAEFLEMLTALDGPALRVAHARLGSRLAASGASRYPRALADLQRLRDGVRERGLSGADSTTLTVLLNQMVAADAGFDPIVEAVCTVDCALDSAQTTLASLLGLPDPDPEDMGGTAQECGASLAFLRAQLETGRV